MHVEVRECLRANFKSEKQAFDYLAEGGTAITSTSFVRAIRSLFPDRFIASDLEDLWRWLAKGSRSSEMVVDENMFMRLYAKQSGQQYFTKTSSSCTLTGGADSRLTKRAHSTAGKL